MLKVMRIYCAALDVEVDVSHAEHLYKSFEALQSAVGQILTDTFFDKQHEIEIKQFSIDPFKPVRYISYDEQIIAEQGECQIEILVLIARSPGEFRFDVATTNEQAHIDAAQKYMRPTSWGHQVNFSKVIRIPVSFTKVIRIPKGHQIPSFISSTNSVDK
ncbi:MAG: hypothetical protein IBX55_22955 [Methyloprofundus sp.]|nr:hypothetical protein [Methyloprofundus sp.]